MKIKDMARWRRYAAHQQVHINPDLVGSRWPTGHYEGKDLKIGFFELFNGETPDLPRSLFTTINIAQTNQAIFEFIQNAVDAGATEMHVWIEDDVLTVVNNGKTFDSAAVRAILNVGASEKTEESIGKFGIGFKLVHALVADNPEKDLIEDGRGPIIFSWNGKENLDEFIRIESESELELAGPAGEPADLVKKSWDDSAGSWLFKIMLTSVPVMPSLHERGLLNWMGEPASPLFKASELVQLTSRLETLMKTMEAGSINLSQGSVFQVDMLPGKQEALTEDLEGFREVIGISTVFIQQLRGKSDPFSRITLNGDDLIEPSQVLPVLRFSGSIALDEETSQQLNIVRSHEGNVSAVEYGVALPALSNSEEYLGLTSGSNFFKYFPMMSEKVGLNMVVHCNLFDIVTNRKEFTDNVRNELLLELIAKQMIVALDELKSTDFDAYCDFFMAVRTSDCSWERDWIRNRFLNPLEEVCQEGVPTDKGSVCSLSSVVVRRTDLVLDLSTLGIQKEWFRYAVNDFSDIEEKAFHWIENDAIWGLDSLIVNADEGAWDRVLAMWKACGSDQIHVFDQELNVEFEQNSSADFWEAIRNSESLLLRLKHWLLEGNAFRQDMVDGWSFDFQEEWDVLPERYGLMLDIVDLARSSDIWLMMRDNATFLFCGEEESREFKSFAVNDELVYEGLVFRRSDLLPEGHPLTGRYREWFDKVLEAADFFSLDREVDSEGFKIFQWGRKQGGEQVSTIAARLDGSVPFVHPDQLVFVILNRRKELGHRSLDFDRLEDLESCTVNLDPVFVLTRLEESDKFAGFDLGILHLLMGRAPDLFVEGAYADEEEQIPSWLVSWIEESPDSRRPLIFREDWRGVHPVDGVLHQARHAFITGGGWDNIELNGFSEDVADAMLGWLAGKGWLAFASSGMALKEFVGKSRPMLEEEILRVADTDYLAYNRIPVMNIIEDQFCLGIACASTLGVWTSKLDEFLEEWDLIAERTDVRMQLVKKGFLLSHEDLLPKEEGSEWLGIVESYSLSSVATCDLSGATSMGYALEFELKDGGPLKWDVFIMPESTLEDTFGIYGWNLSRLPDFNGDYEPVWSKSLRERKVHLDEERGRVYIATGGERSQKAVKESLQWAVEEGALGRKVRAGTLIKAIDAIPNASKVAERIFDKEEEGTVTWLYRMADWELAEAVTKENVSLRFAAAQVSDDGMEAVLTGCHRKEVPDWLDRFVQAEESRCELEWGKRGSRMKQSVIISDVTEHSVAVMAEDGRDLSGVQGKSPVLTIRGVGGWLRKLVGQLQTMAVRDEHWGLLDLLEAEAQKRNLILFEFCRVVFGPPGTGKTTKVVADAMNALAHDMEKGVSSSMVVVVTPTNAAAKATWERFNGLSESASQEGTGALDRGLSQEYAHCYRRMSCSIMPRVTNMEDFGILAVTAHRLLLQSAVIDGLRRYASVRVVFDEASMLSLPLAFGVYELLRGLKLSAATAVMPPLTIAGDPHQLMPVGRTPGLLAKIGQKGWTRSNWFTLLGISEFHTGVKMSESGVEVVPLGKQFRMVPVIGEGVSKFTYGGKLEHGTSKAPAVLGEAGWESSPVIIMPYRVDFNDKSTGVNLIDVFWKQGPGRGYHVHSAMMALAVVKRWLEADPDGEGRMAIVSPYSIQTRMMLELCRASFDEAVMARLTVSTVHRLQGDEVDLVVFVNLAVNRNPGDTSFFNTQNLINVAVSRARRQLVLIHPDDIINDLSRDELIPGFPKEGMIQLELDDVAGFMRAQGVHPDERVEVREFNQVQVETIEPTTNWEYMFHVSHSKDDEKANPLSVLIRKKGEAPEEGEEEW